VIRDGEAGKGDAHSHKVTFTLDSNLLELKIYSNLFKFIGG